MRKAKRMLGLSTFCRLPSISYYHVGKRMKPILQTMLNAVAETIFSVGCSRCQTVCLFVGVGSEIDPVEIADIASHRDFVYNVTGFEALAGVTQQIINMTCILCKSPLS